MNLHNVVRVARWEFFKNIKSPTFLVLTFLIPVIMLAGGLIGYLAGSSAYNEVQSIAVIDETGELFAQLETYFASTPVTIIAVPAEQREQLSARVEEGEFNGYLHLTAEAVQQGRVSYYVPDSRNQNTVLLSEGVRAVLSRYWLEKMGLTAEQIDTATMPVMLEIKELSGEETSWTALVVPLVFAMLLVFATIFTGQVLMYGVIKEKRNRIVEILLSSISAFELLVGKLFGFAALGLIQISIWLAVGLAVAMRFLDFSEIPLGLAELVPSVLFFLGGYILFSAMFAALGATMKDAEGGSQAQGLVVLVPMIPLFATSAIIISPNALWVRIMSFIPPFTPVTMLLRLAATTPPWWEIAAALVILFLAVIFCLRLGARIFSRGLLQFDRLLSFKEIGRMLRKDY